jgi:hypothetical protein
MKSKRTGFLILLLGIIVFSACNNKQCSNKSDSGKQEFDMRSGLNPSRLTIAMWDFSWLYMHYPGGAFEDFDRVTDELLERGFNTVRIDAFPLIIGKIQNVDDEVTIPGDPLRNWGPSDKDRKHAIIKELISFMEITKAKNIQVILSSWGQECTEFPNIKEDFEDKRSFWRAWEKTLDLLADKDLLSHVAYVDFDQEFPYFSPFNKELNRLGKVKRQRLSDAEAMEAAGNSFSGFSKLRWNNGQMHFVRDLMSSTLSHFQREYPGLRFTFSLTSFWKEVRALNIKEFDVLELHFWLTRSARFNNRSGFSRIKKDRGERDYKDYMRRLNESMVAMRPMFLKEMHNDLKFAKEWSDEIAAPLVTTEAWGPWWHMDHEDLDWQWLYDWCEDGMKLSSEYGLWGTTPWNYSHPYWDNWSNKEWYNKVNGRFKKL